MGPAPSSFPAGEARSAVADSTAERLRLDYPPRRNAKTMSSPHLEHIREHFDRVRYGHLVDPSPEALYLGAGDDESFWELIGLRVTGCPMVVLALMRFQRLGLPGIANSRESLSSFLSTLPVPRPSDELGTLSVILPPHDQQIPYFLKRLRAGLQVGMVSLDPARIEVAFDFRLQNPTLVPDLRAEAQPLFDHYYRTTEGHVVRGRSHEIPAAVPDDRHHFVAISSPEQMTPQGIYPLPTLFVNRAYLALRAQVASPEEAGALRVRLPFAVDMANPGGLLPLPGQRAAERPFVGPTPES